MARRRSDTTAASVAYLPSRSQAIPQTVTEGTDAIVGLATEKPGAGSGRFVDRTGEIAW